LCERRGRRKQSREKGMTLTSETWLCNEKQKRHDVILEKVAPLYFFQAGLTCDFQQSPDGKKGKTYSESETKTQSRGFLLMNLTCLDLIQTK
jgi:hypothetical protein